MQPLFIFSKMQIIKKRFNEKFPKLFRFISRIYYFILRLITGKRQTQIIFNKIYYLKSWGSKDSVSGSGSNLDNTENLRKEFPLIIDELNIKSLLDIPCGDFFWMKEINPALEIYIGADIVKEIVKSNNIFFSNDKRSFIVLDLTKDSLPEVDCIFCRDCLPHLSIKLIKAAIKRIKVSNSVYLLSSTYTDCKENKEMHVGGFRPLNLQLKPFYFPKPIKIINDPCLTPTTNLIDKSIGVWKISDLPF